MPVRIVSEAVRLPGATTTGPLTIATFGLLLVIVTGVGVAASVDNSGTVTVGWPPIAEKTSPSRRCCGTATPTGFAITGVTVPGAGMPTTIVSSRVSEPAWKVNVAVP